MRRALRNARGWGLLAALVVASCKDDPPPPEEEGPALRACVEPPTALARPPSGQLPCELLPPGFSP